MKHEEELDAWLRETLQGQSPLAPPSADYQQRVMQRVIAMPMYRRRRSDQIMLIGGVLLALATTVGSGYLLWTYGPSVLSTITAGLQWLSWDVSPVWVLAGLGYALIARMLLAFGALAFMNQRRTHLLTQL